MNNSEFIITLAITAALLFVVGVSKYIAHFEIGKRIAARREAYRIENATADQAFNDPMLRALIACPSCGVAGDFDVVGKSECRCRACGHTWSAS